MLAVCKPRTLLGDRDRAILLCLLDSSCRAAEFLALNVGDIDLGGGAVTVRRGKGGKSRTTFLGAKARKALLAYLRHRLPVPARQADAARGQGLAKLPDEMKREFEARYDALLEAGLRMNPPPEPTPACRQAGARGVTPSAARRGAWWTGCGSTNERPWPACCRPS